MTNSKYYKIKKSTLHSVLASATVLGGLTALTIGLAEFDRRNSGVELPCNGIESKCIFDVNKDGNPDYTRVTIPLPPSRFPFTYQRQPTQEEINYFKENYKRTKK